MTPAGKKEDYHFCPRCGGELKVGIPEGDAHERLLCRDCGFVFYLDPKVAACAIPVLDGKALLVRRAINPSWGKWVFPGGYMERGETVEEAAIRETMEEAGVVVGLKRLVGIYSYHDSAVVVVVFEAGVIEGSPKAGEECLETRLFAPDEIPWEKLAFSSTRDALAAWRKTLTP